MARSSYFVPERTANAQLMFAVTLAAGVDDRGGCRPSNDTGEMAGAEPAEQSGVINNDQYSRWTKFRKPARTFRAHVPCHAMSHHMVDHAHSSHGCDSSHHTTSLYYRNDYQSLSA